MKKRLLTAFFFIAFIIPYTKAQYVTIPDPGMVAWLTNTFPDIMLGNQMDTSISNYYYDPIEIINDVDISNTYGLQFFDGVMEVTITNTLINTIPGLPANITYAYISENPNLTSIQELPLFLDEIHCIENALLSLPPLPPTLSNLICNNNQISILPDLPNSLIYLDCAYNNISFLPELPPYLFGLDCSGNPLTFLPELPDGLDNMAINNIPTLTCLPLLPEVFSTLDMSPGYTITCLPNYGSNLFELLDGSPLPPLCQPNNAFGCPTANSISGAFFNNQANNCLNLGNLSAGPAIQLFDNQNNFLQSESIGSNTEYSFTVPTGQYLVSLDSSFYTNSVSISCPISGEYNVAAVLGTNYPNNDFGFNCVGADIGVQAIAQQGIVFPGQPHSVMALAGDLSNLFELNCANGNGGTLQVTVNGPVNYTGPSVGALTPSVVGNTYTYSIADFASTNIQQSFILNFITQTTAQSGDTVSVSATLTPSGADIDATNNTLTYTYLVLNSYDPNMKEVNPVDVLPGYEDYFTYTIHFQNLGTAPAFNINIKDTLDSDLDFSTFRVINASHDYSHNLSGSLLNFYFLNIMLADSASNPEGSKGFVQYQVKPKANLPLGTSIENTAHIFFDFNEAVVTNTTVNNFVEEVGINEIASSAFSIYPNPSNGNITIVNQNGGNETLNIEIYDLLGKKLVGESLSFKNGSSNMSLSLAAGTYLVSIENKGNVGSYRMVIN